MAKNISYDDLTNLLKEAHEKFKNENSGANADYIPYLAGIDSSLFGIALVLPDGRTIETGDTQYRFGIESVSKVLTAALIIEEYGAQEVLKRIGADATGLPFNSIMAILLEKEHPSTPLVNAGAITNTAPNGRSSRIKANTRHPIPIR